MKILKHPKTKVPFLSLVVCQHGNEQLGLKIFDALAKIIDRYPGLQLIIANEEAVKINKRCVEQDLNRSYPGNPKGKLEARLAHRLLKEVAGSEYVLDVHTTVSDAGFLTPIFGKRSKQTHSVINNLPSKKIVFIRKTLVKCSLIGNVVGGVSLEFGKEQFSQKSVDLTLKLVEDLYAKTKRAKKEREIFYVSGIIPASTPLPKNAKNFVKVPGKNIYPILLKESAYMGNQGLKGTRKAIVKI